MVHQLPNRFTVEVLARCEQAGNDVLSDRPSGVRADATVSTRWSSMLLCEQLAEIAERAQNAERGIGASSRLLRHTAARVE